MDRRGSNNKEDHTQDVFFFLFFFKTPSKSTFFAVIVPNLVIKMSSKVNKNDHAFFEFSDLFCSFLLFLPWIWLTKCQTENGKIMPPGKSQDVLCLFVARLPPPPNFKHILLTYAHMGCNVLLTL